MKTSLILSFLLLLASVAHASNGQSSMDIGQDISEESLKASAPMVWIGINTAPLGIGSAFGAPIIPLEAGIRIFDGLSIGPLATFSGTYRYQETDLSVMGFGGQVMWNFGQSAIADGFYISGFYQHYSMSGTKMTTIDGLGGMAIPLEGSLPIDSFGGGIGYQWVWNSGFRISAGVQLDYLKTNASGITLMGMSSGDLASLTATPGTQVSQKVNLMDDRSLLIPMPELSVGWSL